MKKEYHAFAVLCFGSNPFPAVPMDVEADGNNIEVVGVVQPTFQQLEEGGEDDPLADIRNLYRDYTTMLRIILSQSLTTPTTRSGGCARRRPGSGNYRETCTWRRSPGLAWCQWTTRECCLTATTLGWTRAGMSPAPSRRQA